MCAATENVSYNYAEWLKIRIKKWREWEPSYSRLYSKYYFNTLHYNYICISLGPKVQICP